MRPHFLRLRPLVLPFVGSALVACYDRPTPLADAPACASTVTTALSPRRFRRLSNWELQNVATDLAGEPFSFPEALLPDARVDGFDDNAATLVVSSPRLDGYLEVADALAAKVAGAFQCTADEAARDCAARF